MEHTFNGGRLILTDDTISIKKIFGSQELKRHKISSMTYQYDNVIYRIVRIPLGLFYIATVLGIPVGLRCLRGDIRAHVKMSNYDTHSFWIYGTDYKEFKEAL